MFTKAQAEAYFIAEKQESLLFLIIGIIAILAGIVFVAALKTPIWKGMAIPLIAIGLIQCVVGYTVYSRSDAQRKDIVYKMDMNPGAIQSDEIPRMEKVMDNFSLYRWVEIVFLVAGLTIWFMTRNDAGKLWLLGLGIGLVIQAALMLGADYFAEQRGAKYLTGLRSLVRQAP